MRAHLVLAGLVALAGCGPAVNAPSLRPRPAESRPILPPEAAREGASPIDPGLGDALARQRQAADAGHAAFLAAARTAERAVAAATSAPHGGEAWTRAQEQVSAMEAARAPVQDAVVALDALRAAPENRGSAARQLVAATAEQIHQLDAAEGKTAAALIARLP